MKKLRIALLGATALGLSAIAAAPVLASAMFDNAPANNQNVVEQLAQPAAAYDASTSCPADLQFLNQDVADQQEAFNTAPTPAADKMAPQRLATLSPAWSRFADNSSPRRYRT